MKVYLIIKNENVSKVKDVVIDIFDNYSEDEQILGNVREKISEDGDIIPETRDFDSAWFNNSYEFNFTIDAPDHVIPTLMETIDETIDLPEEEKYTIAEMKCNIGMIDDEFENEFFERIDSYLIGMVIDEDE